MIKGRVLIIDDSREIVDVVTVALNYIGYSTINAVGLAALHLAGEQQPDLILLDLMMPHIDGAEMVRRLRRDPRTARIPIVLMSACHDAQIITADLPIDARLNKPFDLDDLFAVVGYWSHQRQGDALHAMAQSA